MNIFSRFSGDNAKFEVSVLQAAEALESSSHVLLDVREQDEWDDAHVPNSVHIPLGELVARATELPDDKPVYTICHSGARSLYAIALLEQGGREGAKSVAGGIDAWVRAGKPVHR